jgi:hypothetical protein
VRLKNSKYLDAGIFHEPQELATLGAFVLGVLVSSTFLWAVCFELCAILPYSAKPCQVDFLASDPKLQCAAANCGFLLASSAATKKPQYLAILGLLRL